MTSRGLTGRIERIAVFRARGLGDVLCATPALRALRAGFPDARITLVGIPVAAVLAERLSCLDDFIAFPATPSPAGGLRAAAGWPEVLAGIRQQNFDLALQFHDGGAIASRLVAAFGARHTAGFALPGARPPVADATLSAPWPETGNEIERLLGLVDRLAIPRRGTQLEFPLRRDDRVALWDLWPGADEGIRYVCIHPGAQSSSRRWSIRQFAAVGDLIAARGRTVVLTGSEAEQDVVAEVAAYMHHTPVNLCGRTTLWTLGALIASAESVICNDTGVAQIAAALNRPSVVISCGTDVHRRAPLDRQRHRVLVHPGNAAGGTTVQQVLDAYSGSPASKTRNTLTVESRSFARFS
jgi:ADP-heptose:LPS heptosyltransferase